MDKWIPTVPTNHRCNRFDNNYIWPYINGNNDDWQKPCYEVLEGKSRGPPTTMNVPSVKMLAARQTYTTIYKWTVFSLG